MVIINCIRSPDRVNKAGVIHREESCNFDDDKILVEINSDDLVKSQISVTP